MGAVDSSAAKSCPVHVVPFPLPLNSFVCPRAAFQRDAPLRVYLENVCVLSFLFLFGIQLFVLFLSLLGCLFAHFCFSFYISASGFSFFFFYYPKWLVSRF